MPGARPSAFALPPEQSSGSGRTLDDRGNFWLDVWHNHGQTASVARKHYIRAEYADLKRDVAEAIDSWLAPVLLGDRKGHLKTDHLQTSVDQK